MSDGPPDLLSWPVVPKDQRPRKMYVRHYVEPDDEMALKEQGWEIIDVRLMPQATASDYEARIKAQLEGINLGSILPEKNGLKYLELEARTYAMLLQKERQVDPAKSKSVLARKHVDALLSEIGTKK
jgi:hypothetical protein